MLLKSQANLSILFFNSILKHYLKELCSWAHKYIRDCDQYRSNGSLKANIVFFSVCQAIFYVIAFRSRDLTVDKKSKFDAFYCCRYLKRMSLF